MNLVSNSDIAEMANVKPNTVVKWIQRHADTPKPIAVTAGGAIYNRKDWERWLIRTGRWD